MHMYVFDDGSRAEKLSLLLFEKTGKIKLFRDVGQRILGTFSP